jgi:hypothetical protein
MAQRGIDGERVLTDMHAREGGDVCRHGVIDDEPGKGMR